MQREQRRNRGVRVTELVGSDAENDETFWGHDTWHEEASDGEYSSESDQPDVFDSDFNESESEDDMDSEEEEAALRKQEKRRQETNRKRKATYQEPTAKRKKPATTAGTGALGSAKPRQRHARRAAAAAAAHLGALPLERARRASTVSKTKASETTRLADERVSRSRARPKTDRVKSQFTQEAMLTESIETEQDNTRWILSMQRLSRQRAQQLRGAQRQTRSAVRFLSRRGSTTTVTFSEVDAQPDFLRPGSESAAPRPRALQPAVCHVTGLPARYRDPLTNLPYANAAAFRTVRAEQAGDDPTRLHPDAEAF